MPNAAKPKKKYAKAGQPTKFKEQYCDEVIVHLSQGYTLASWAGSVDVSRETAYNWANAHPEFFNAIKVGRAKGQHIWESKLLNQADSGQGNTAAIIFAMKNLYVDDWSDRIITEHSGEVKVKTLADFYSNPKT